MIEYLIVIFPAFDVFSIFPILNNVLSDNILAVVFKANESNEISYKLYVAARATTCTLPFFIAFFFFNLGPILDWAGVFAILSALVSIPCISIVVRKMVDGDSDYTNVFTHIYLAHFLVWFGLLLFLFVLISLLIDAIEET